MIIQLASLALLLGASVSATASSGLQGPRAIKLTSHRPSQRDGHEKRDKAVVVENESHDARYRLKFKVGTPEQTVEAVLDSTSPVTSLYGRPTEEQNPGFQGNKSSTFKMLEATRGSQMVALDRAVDKITMGDDTRDDIAFYYNNEPLGNGDAWGFGLPTEFEPEPSFWQAAAKGWADPRMGLFLSRRREGPKPQGDRGKDLDYADSEIMTGGVNQDKYTGEINMYPFQPGPRGGWPVPLEGITVNGKAVSLSANSTDSANNATSANSQTVEARLMTFAQWIYVPRPVAEAIYANIPGAELVPAANNPGNDAWQFPCNTTGIDVRLTIGGHEYPMQSTDMVGGLLGPNDRGGVILAGPTPDTGMCAGVIMGPNDGWQIGNAFLKNVYTVFDFNTPAVGFAQLAPDAQPDNVKGTSESRASPGRGISSIAVGVAAAAVVAALV